MVLIQNHHTSEAILELYERYSSKLLGFFIKMLHNDKELAQDFVQELFLRILEKKQLYDPEKKFYTWLFTIANNMCKTAYRSSGRVIRFDAQTTTIAAQSDDSKLEKELFLVALEHSMNSLEEHHKSVFVLRYLEEFSLNDIAEILDISLGTVKSRLFYGTRILAKQLHAFDPRFEHQLFKINE